MTYVKAGRETGIERMRLRHQSLATVANRHFERQANQLLAVDVF